MRAKVETVGGGFRISVNTGESTIKKVDLLSETKEEAWKRAKRFFRALGCDEETEGMGE